MTFDANGEPVTATEAEWREWFKTHPENLTEDECTAREFNLPLERVPLFNKMKAQKFTEWPDEAYLHVRAFATSKGVCGETIIAGLADWLRHNPDYKGTK